MIAENEAHPGKKRTLSEKSASKRSQEGVAGARTQAYVRKRALGQDAVRRCRTALTHHPSQASKRF